MRSHLVSVYGILIIGMGIFEDKSKKKTRRQNIQKIILASVSIAGFMTIAAVAPNAIQALKLFGFDPKKRQKEIMMASIDRLIRQKFLEFKNGFIRLTTKGERKLKEFELRDWKVDKPKNWDKKWRVLIFDIPEKRRALRNKIRLTLISIGFLLLQDSVWIYPYDCEDLINLLKADFKVGKKLLYLIVDSVENDKNFRTAFNLPKEL